MNSIIEFMSLLIRSGIIKIILTIYWILLLIYVNRLTSEHKESLGKDHKLPYSSLILKGLWIVVIVIGGVTIYYVVI